jgi:hypothetical protein
MALNDVWSTYWSTQGFELEVGIFQVFGHFHSSQGSPHSQGTIVSQGNSWFPRQPRSGLGLYLHAWVSHAMPCFRFWVSLSLIAYFEACVTYFDGTSTLEIAVVALSWNVWACLTLP